MAKRKPPQKVRRGWVPRWWTAALITGIVAVVVGIAWVAVSNSWFAPGTGGTPRVTVDRTDLDLGYRRFNTSANAVFTVSNAGTGVLHLDVPEVTAVKGC